MRVGRAALDEDAIRLLEEYNPDVEFDWTRILKGQAEPERESPASTGDTRRDRDARRNEPAANPIDVRTDGSTASVAAASPLPHELDQDDADEPREGLTPSAALTRLGAEALLRLRARYAELMARISDRISDPATQEELKSKAERLNPDTWVTDEEVRLGLDVYEETFEQLRASVGGSGTRRRRANAEGSPQVNSGPTNRRDGRPSSEPHDNDEPEP